jgi:hypothetical protein
MVGFSGERVPMDDVTSTKVRSVAEEIRALARQHGVVYEPTPLDELGNVITRLAGDDVELDETQLLLLALVRAGVLTKEKSTNLRARYIRAKYE